jgi:hypothetical protein
MSSVVVARMSPTEIRRALALDGAGPGTVWGEQKAQQMLAKRCSPASTSITWTGIL